MPDALYDFLLECWDKVRDFLLLRLRHFLHGAQPGHNFAASPPLASTGSCETTCFQGHFGGAESFALPVHKDSAKAEYWRSHFVSRECSNSERPHGPLQIALSMVVLSSI